ncbi:2-dehydropantoate 2-reductase N-terminal domain-containing protein [Oscillospiraceae bacterium PP1C4]
MKEKVLIFGAGVIGSIYAARLSNAGVDVTIYARNRRLDELQTKGLLYLENDKICKADINVISEIPHADSYDFAFLTVRYEQMQSALAELKNSSISNIVTMVNNPCGYDKWEDSVGFGRIIPAFPGAGGTIVNGVLHYKLTPYLVQPTTFGELTGTTTERITRLAVMMKNSKIPYSICRDMDAWQKSHLAMVIPLANGICADGGNNYTTANNKKMIRAMSLSLKENFIALAKAGIAITPFSLSLFRTCPIWLMDLVLKNLYSTRFAETLISSHANNAKLEMLTLDQEFKQMLAGKGISLKNSIPVNHINADA